MKQIVCLLFSASILISCNQPTTEPSQEINTEGFEKQLQEKLINAKRHQVIEIPEGVFELSRTLSLVGIPNITIKGAGQAKTILSFKNQTEGAEGLKISTTAKITISDLTIQDTKGDAIKIDEVKGVTLKNISVRWSGGANVNNGGYGIYPVSCQNVLIETCAVSGASDAGIYVGQSQNIIVRNCLAFENVAGIEIENCIDADVYDNKVNNNTAGIFIFDMPELPQKNGEHIRVFNNVLKDNNHINFAPVGNTVEMVPAGTGSLIMSTRHIEFFKNTISNHQTTSTAIISFLLTKKPFTDSLYNPYPSAIYVHDNTYKQEPAMPDTSKELGKLIAQLFGNNPPHIIYDGIINPALVNKKGVVEEPSRICIRKNGEVRFANINAPSGFKKVITDPKQYDCEQAELGKIKIIEI